jgi:A/G-specific adenine glycosylase
MKPKSFQQAILNWFKHKGRTNLPWQNPITPYRVWISEIMLQQTQVATVIPYFERFMQSFPCIESLANASVDDVLHHWTGLGYYARARNLHKTAQIIAFEYQQQFPDTVEALSALPGIGRSTAGAIRSIGFKKPAAILDGNVKRVLARFSATAGWPGKTAVHNELWEIAEYYSPLKRTEHYTQAMMDLGALVCTRSNPQCDQCPIKPDCKAALRSEQSLFPGKKPKKAIPVRESIFLMLRSSEGEILLQQNPPAGLWGGLWVLPMIDQLSELDALAEGLQLEVKATKFLTQKRHTFSHFHLDYQVFDIEVLALNNKVTENSNVVWYNRNNPLSLGMSAPVKALLN